MKDRTSTATFPIRPQTDGPLADDASTPSPPPARPGPSGPSTGEGRASALPLDRLALRLDDIAAMLGVSRRAIEREKSAGRLPRPDRIIGRMPLWRVETIREWLGGNGR